MKTFKKAMFGMTTALVLAGTTLCAPAFAAEAQPADAPQQEAAAPEVKTYTTEDGVLQITAPSDNDLWVVIQDDQNWFALSDGTDTITVDHYANGDQLPAPEVADDNFVQIYQVYYSTRNEVFVVTGKVTVDNDMPYVKDAVNSFVVLQYDTVKKEETPQPVYDLKPIGATMYCTTPDGVNVRADHSIDSAVIGEISYRDSVYVNGNVTKDGADTGWYQIQYGDGVGYVWEDWFDVNQPPADPVRTGDEMTVYSYDGSETREIYFYTDGIWRDDSGNTYSGGMSAEVDCSDGTVWYESPMGPSPTGEEMTIYSYDGSETREIYFYSDGVWRDDYWNSYSTGMSAELDCSDGTVWYESPMEPVPTGESMAIYTYDGSQMKTIYHYNDGLWRDDDMNIYYGGMSAELDCSDGSVWYESPMEEPEKPTLLGE